MVRSGHDTSAEYLYAEAIVQCSSLPMFPSTSHQWRCVISFGESKWLERRWTFSQNPLVWMRLTTCVLELNSIADVAGSRSSNQSPSNRIQCAVAWTNPVVSNDKRQWLCSFPQMPLGPKYVV